MKRIAIKIGTSVLTRADGTLNVTRMSSLIDQMAELHGCGTEIIIISSGAVASGRNEIKIEKKLDSVSARQLYSAIGQTKLINRYYELFRNYGIICGQVLTTKENFSSRVHYLNQKHCMMVMLENKVIPIVNENDTISVDELMFTDNDELSALITTMMKMDSLIILSDVDGIYNGAPTDPNADIIQEITLDENISNYIVKSIQSSFGRGGMQSKYRIAKEVASKGISVIIANGQRENILLSLLREKNTVIHTKFKPSKKSISSVKTWVSYSKDFAKGDIYINDGVIKAIKEIRTVSILFVGIVRIVGNFEKDDIIRIVDKNGFKIGVGKSNYSSKEAAKYIGKHSIKPLIHYNYLYIE
jgi:glutamate 5-kinase